MSRNPVRPRILCVGHGTIESNSGGVEVYQRLIAERLGGEFEFLFFAPDLNQGEPGSYVLYSLETGLRESFMPEPRVLPEHESHPGLEQIFKSILIRYEISLVHFHHLLRQVPSLPRIAQDCSVPTLLSIHDFYTVCDEYNLLNPEGRYCGVLERGTAECDSCLYVLRGYRKGSQERRISAFLKAMDATDRILFNTAGIRDSIKSVFPGLPLGKTSVIGAPSGTRFSTPVSRPESGPLRILIPNGLSRLKGGEVLCELLGSTRDLPLEYHFFGNTDRAYPEERIRKLNPSVVFHGHYTRAELEAFAPSAHLSLHASIWPETYCISLSEMWDLGIVPVGTRIGALGERIHDGENGFSVEPGDAPALKAVLLRILGNRPALERLRSRLRPGLSTHADECAEALKVIYSGLLECKASAPVTHQDSAKPVLWSTGRGPKSRTLRRWFKRLTLFS